MIVLWWCCWVHAAVRAGTCIWLLLSVGLRFGVWGFGRELYRAAGAAASCSWSQPGSSIGHTQVAVPVSCAVTGNGMQSQGGRPGCPHGALYGVVLVAYASCAGVLGHVLDSGVVQTHTERP